MVHLQLVVSVSIVMYCQGRDDIVGEHLQMIPRLS